MNRKVHDASRRSHSRRGGSVASVLPAIATVILLASSQCYHSPVDAALPAAGRLRRTADNTSRRRVSSQHHHQQHQHHQQPPPTVAPKQHKYNKRNLGFETTQGVEDYSDLLGEFVEEYEYEQLQEQAALQEQQQQQQGQQQVQGPIVADAIEESLTLSSDSFGAEDEDEDGADTEEQVEDEDEEEGAVEDEDVEEGIVAEGANTSDGMDEQSDGGEEEDIDDEAEELFDLLQEQLAVLEAGGEEPEDVQLGRSSTDPVDIDSLPIETDEVDTSTDATDAPTMADTSTEEPTITFQPTPMHSAQPSTQPSATPSLSSAPTATPSSAPSVSRTPTLHPTAPPTFVPTELPTNAPTPAPTTSAPTSAPTPACHDLGGYKSPINGLGCQQHVGSNCESWRHIGLTDVQIVELHTSCPVSCGTDCELYTLAPSAAPSAAPSSSPTNSLKDVIAFLDLYLYDASGPMPMATRNVFEQTLETYFEAVLDESDATKSSHMTAVTIADQGAIGTSELVGEPRSGGGERRRTKNNRLLRIRILDDERLNIKVKVIAEATTRHLDSAMFKAVLHASINDSTALSDALVEADDYFAGIMISNELIDELNTKSTPEAKSDESKVPTAAIVVSSISVIAVAGVLTGHYLFKRHYGDRKKRAEINSFFTFSPKGSYLPEGEEGLQNDQSDLKGNGSIFSFEESPVYRLPPNAASIKGPGLLESRSGSHTTASGSDTSSGNGASLPMKMADDQQIIVSPPNSPENLLAGIPPMIVIDNIDQTGSGEVDDDDGVPAPPENSPPSKPSSRPRSNLPKADKNGIPIRRIEASSAIAKALRSDDMDGSIAGNSIAGKEPLTLMEMIDTVKSIEDEDDDGRSPISQCLSPAFEKVWNDGDSVASMPGAGADTAAVKSPQMRQCHSTDEVENIEPSKALNELIRSEWANLGLSPKADDKKEDDEKSDIYTGPTYHQNLFVSEADDSVEPLQPLSPRKEPQRGITRFVSSLTQFSQQSRESSRASSPVRLSPKKRDREALDYKPDLTSVASGETDCASEAKDKFDFVTKPGLFNMSMAKFERKMNKIGNKYQGKKDQAFPKDAEVKERDAKVQKTMPRSLSDSRLSASRSASMPSVGISGMVPVSPTSEKSMRNSINFSPRALPPPSPISSNQSRVVGLKRSVTQRGSTEGYRYIFEAPSNGKLGIIIHKTVVHTVKDYSPLFGMVDPGDKIVQIDDISTENMTTGEVTRVLASKRSGKDKTRMIRITIVSLVKKRGLKIGSREEDHDRSTKVVLPVSDKKTKHVTINTAAPISHVYMDNNEHGENSSLIVSDTTSPRFSDVGDDIDGSFHLLGACPRSEDEDDDEEDCALHLLGSIYSSGSGEPQKAEDLEEAEKNQIAMEDVDVTFDEVVKPIDKRAPEDVLPIEKDDGGVEDGAAAEVFREAAEQEESDQESDAGNHLMGIMDAGSEESDESSLDFAM